MDFTASLPTETPAMEQRPPDESDTYNSYYSDYDVWWRDDVSKLKTMRSEGHTDDFVSGGAPAVGLLSHCHRRVKTSISMQKRKAATSCCMVVVAHSRSVLGSLNFDIIL